MNNLLEPLGFVKWDTENLETVIWFIFDIVRQEIDKRRYCSYLGGRITLQNKQLAYMIEHFEVKLIDPGVLWTVGCFEITSPGNCLNYCFFFGKITVVDWRYNFVQNGLYFCLIMNKGDFEFIWKSLNYYNINGDFCSDFKI